MTVSQAREVFTRLLRVPAPSPERIAAEVTRVLRRSASLQRTGQLQPIRVRWSEEHGKWIIISGERRYRAALLAGLRTVSYAFTDRPLTESEVRQEPLVENLLREDLRPIEAADGCRQLMDLNGWTMQQVAEALNVSKGAVSEALSLLKPPEDVREQVEREVNPPSSGCEVSRLEDERAQRELAARIVGEGLKRDDAGAAVGETARPKAKKGGGAGVVEAGSTTTRTFAVADARLAITWPRRSVGARDVVQVLEEARSQLRGRGVESDAA
ncbi:ParB/RepB/Spo0J family partition protein [Planctomyces sp. SH-PL62]|uniref:ParB/RepB/Spo0J family partition protein n=1 Tax=Planctomyces sp. SH-PL62 TaxID=1636152 RepID=UPI00078C4A0F|nr:ParB/RepB/Spo0J family partition protein [Planctomyces sp. SH-PL62]AMV40938.1 Chromosome-partitioning protein Spo0J [Planctomyces sp. SH-PL62]